MDAREAITKLRRIVAEAEGAERDMDGHRMTTLSDYEVEAIEFAEKVLTDLARLFPE